MERTAGGITYTLTRRRVRNINLRVRADGSVAASASPRVPDGLCGRLCHGAGRLGCVPHRRVPRPARTRGRRGPALPPKAEALAYMQTLCRAYYPQFAATCRAARCPKLRCAT